MDGMAGMGVDAPVRVHVGRFQLVMLLSVICGVLLATSLWLGWERIRVAAELERQAMKISAALERE